MESFIVSFLPIVFFISVGFIGFSVNFYFAKQRREKMENLAKELGLEFQVSNRGKTILDQVPQNKQVGPSSQGVIQLLFSIFSDWKITGNYQDNFVEIYTETRGSGKSKSTYTIIFLKAKQPLAFKMEITPQGVFQGLFIKLFKMEDIQVGDEKFDKRFVIKGDNPEEIKKLCKDRSVQESIYKLMDEAEYRIVHNGIYFEKNGVITDSLFYKQKLEKMNSTCSKVFSEGSVF
ncbi:MAG: hypothetical protein IPL26_24105 [Leptospiraceae bacterium]|nr:hypothetical protein [Leptospiraceae bacterium]